MNAVEFVLNDAPAVATLQTLARFPQRPQAALADIGEALVQSTRLRFNDSVAPDGKKWAPLAMATIIKRAARSRSMRRGGPLVTRAGHFRAAFSRAVAAGAANARPLMDTRQHLFQSLSWKVEGTVLIWGVGVRWGSIHQFGGKAGRGHKVTIPARPYLGISAQDRVDITALLARHSLAAAIASARGFA